MRIGTSWGPRKKLEIVNSHRYGTLQAVLRIRIRIISLDPDPCQKLGGSGPDPCPYQILRTRIQQKPLKTENKSQLRTKI